MSQPHLSKSPSTSVYPKPMSRHPTPAPFPSPVAPTRSSSFTSSSSSLKPYLSLPSRLSQTVLSLPLLSLILSLISLVSANNAAKSRAEDAKSQILSSCRGVEEGVRFLTDGRLADALASKVNEGVVSGVQGMLRGLEKVLIMSLTIMETVIAFMIDTYRSLLMCTIEFIVRGVLAALIGIVQTISDGITSSLATIRTSIQSDVESANTLISRAIQGINSVTSLVHVNLSVPQFTIPSLDALANVTIATGFEDDLKRLNQSLPTLDEFRKGLDDLVSIPFEALKGELNGTFDGLVGRVNVTALPLPSRAGNVNGTTGLSRRGEEAFDLCSDLDTSFLDTIVNDLSKLAKIGTGILVLAFFLLWIALIAWEWFSWRQAVEQSRSVEELVQRDVQEGRNVDGMRLVQIVDRPVVEKYGGAVLRRMTRDEGVDRNARWFLAYITHPPALLLLAFGILTFLVMQIQLSAVSSIRERSTTNANSAISAQAESLGLALNQAMADQSKQYAVEMNLVIAGWQNEIDEGVFGPWLNTTAVTLNTTLVSFYDKIEDVLNSTFGGTVLAPSVNTFVYCILGSKIDALSTGLTWIHDNAHITLPTIDPDVLMLSDATMNEVAQPIAQAAAGNGTSSDGDDQGIIGKLFDRYEDELRKQRNIAAIFIGLYGVIVLIGLAVFVWHSWLRRRVSQWRMQHRGEDAHFVSETSPRFQEKHYEEKVRPDDTSVTTEQAMENYYAHDRDDNQGSFLDYPEENRTRFSRTNSYTGLADRIRALSPLRRNFSKDVYDEPMLPQQQAQPSQYTGWGNKIGKTFGNYLNIPVLGAPIGRKDSQRSQTSEKSWAGASQSPAAAKAFHVGPTYQSEKSRYPPVTKITPSPLNQNHFTISDDEDEADVGTPIAARFTSKQLQRPNDPFASPYDSSAR